mmetsp:Transcript_6311/g.10889  ORF Transcript_6311/g.10889 Transcript_6311/m.10889 type:complete len:231 (+) Transcript_6311:120-812(+)
MGSVTTGPKRQPSCELNPGQPRPRHLFIPQAFASTAALWYSVIARRLPESPAESASDAGAGVDDAFSSPAATPASDRDDDPLRLRDSFLPEKVLFIVSTKLDLRLALASSPSSDRGVGDSAPRSESLPRFPGELGDPGAEFGSEPPLASLRSSSRFSSIMTLPSSSRMRWRARDSSSSIVAFAVTTACSSPTLAVAAASSSCVRASVCTIASRWRRDTSRFSFASCSCCT